MRNLSLVLACASIAGVASPAQADVVSADAQGVVIRHVAETASSPMDSWKVLTVPARWWGKAHTFSGDAGNLYIDSQATGCFCEKLPLPADAPEGQRPGSVEHMHIVFANPGKALRMVGALGPLQSEAVHGTLTVAFKPIEGGTRIVWEYVFGGFMRHKSAEIAVAVDKVLGEQLSGLIKELGPLKAAAVAEPVIEAETKAEAPSPAEPVDGQIAVDRPEEEAPKSEE